MILFLSRVSLSPLRRAGFFNSLLDIDIIIEYHNIMNVKARKTLAALFASPVSRSIAFRDLSSLLMALGFTIRQGEGSRMDFIYGNVTLHLHEPHPGKEIKPYQVKAVRAFLLNIGVKP
jgi:hypothetical protein